MTYFVHCMIASEALSMMVELRERHLGYIRGHLATVKYGGLVGEEDRPPERLCYFLDLPSRDAALRFVEADPYRPIFERVEVLPFQQRIPGALSEES